MAGPNDLDLVSRLTDDERAVARFRLRCVNPNDGKYGKESEALIAYFGAEAEWRTCALVQAILLEARAEFGLADEHNIREVRQALDKIDPLNMALLEERVTKHDQLAVIEEIGRYISPETKALLHPGTTSYDILDTARAYLLRNAWKKVMRPKAIEVIKKLCASAEKYMDVIQVGRTHLQDTSPVTFGWVLAGYAARLADRVKKCGTAFGDLRGKISGIVGTGASVEIVVGKNTEDNTALDFEYTVLNKLGLEPDYTATQVVQKERLADVGHSMVTLMHVLGDFAEDMRKLYSSAIREVVSLDSAVRLGGSSADAAKDNPINWENIAGKVAVVESGMRVLYAMIQTDFQRDLRSSVQARYQPAGMIVETYESLCRASKALNQLSVRKYQMAQNLELLRKFPSEAMVAITRAHGWTHPTYGVGHDAVREYSKTAKREGMPLLDAALRDPPFAEFFTTLSEKEQRILRGELELYLGAAKEKARKNIEYARNLGGLPW